MMTPIAESVLKVMRRNIAETQATIGKLMAKKSAQRNIASIEKLVAHQAKMVARVDSYVKAYPSVAQAPKREVVRVHPIKAKREVVRVHPIKAKREVARVHPIKESSKVVQSTLVKTGSKKTKLEVVNVVKAKKTASKTPATEVKRPPFRYFATNKIVKLPLVKTSLKLTGSNSRPMKEASTPKQDPRRPWRYYATNQIEKKPIQPLSTRRMKM